MSIWLGISLVLMLAAAFVAYPFFFAELTYLALQASRSRPI